MNDVVNGSVGLSVSGFVPSGSGFESQPMIVSRNAYVKMKKTATEPSEMISPGAELLEVLDERRFLTVSEAPRQSVHGLRD